MTLWHLTIKIQTVENYRTNAISFWYTYIFPRNKLQCGKRSKGIKNRLNRLKDLSISIHRSCLDPALNCLKKILWSNQGNFSSDLRYNLQVIWLGMCFQIIRMGDYRRKRLIMSWEILKEKEEYMGVLYIFLFLSVDVWHSP